jgi:hypothetical protein
MSGISLFTAAAVVEYPGLPASPFVKGSPDQLRFLKQNSGFQEPLCHN